MVIKNLTSESRGFTAVDFRDGREFTIYVGAYGCTEIQDMYIPNIKSLEGIFEVVGDTSNKPSPNLSNEEDSKREEKVYEEEDKEGLDENSNEVSEDSNAGSDEFICDVCGQEFASARGLSSHKNRAHLEE